MNTDSKPLLMIKQLVYSMLVKTLIVSVLFTSCESENMPDIEKKIVIDGWIEAGGNPHVILTYNTGYFDNLDSASYRELVERFAKVIVYNDKQREVLTLTRDTNYFPPFIYKGNEIKGEEGKEYTLMVINKGDTITSSTTILTPVKIDSLWFEFVNDTAGFIKGKFHDNPDEKNYYRTFTKLGFKKGKFIPTLVSIFNDTYFNGEYFTFSLKKGVESYLKPLEDIYFRRGDTIMVKVSSIDAITYDFWRTYDEEVMNSGNPFAANFSVVKSNINGGLGIWCGYGSSYYSVIAK